MSRTGLEGVHYYKRKHPHGHVDWYYSVTLRTAGGKRVTKTWYVGTNRTKTRARKERAFRAACQVRRRYLQWVAGRGQHPLGS